MFCKLLSPDHIEAIRRTAKVKSISIEQTIATLGLATEAQVAEALARYAGLRFVKINPLDLDLDVDRANNVQVRMTLTAPACPAAQTIPIEVERRVREVPGVNDVKVAVVWDPPWTRDMMSEMAKLSLGMY